MAITRDRFYECFGPKLIEAILRWAIDDSNAVRSRIDDVAAGIVRLVVPQFNVLRAEHGMTEVDVQQVLQALKNDIGTTDILEKSAVLDNLKEIWSTLPDYDWMED
jgi:hypothetical protein